MGFREPKVEADEDGKTDDFGVLVSDLMIDYASRLFSAFVRTWHAQTACPCLGKGRVYCFYPQVFGPPSTFLSSAVLHS